MAQSCAVTGGSRVRPDVKIKLNLIFIELIYQCLCKDKVK